MSVNNYQSTLRKIKEERISRSHCGGSLKLRNERITDVCLINKAQNILLSFNNRIMCVCGEQYKFRRSTSVSANKCVNFSPLGLFLNTKFSDNLHIHTAVLTYVSQQVKRERVAEPRALSTKT